METFFTTSNTIQQIIKNFHLTKTLFVSSIIIGEPHTGKKSLARYLFPNASLISGKNQDELTDALKNSEELIITDFEKISNKSNIDFSNKRIIATANYLGNPHIIDELFAFIYTMPSLHERPNDVKYLCKKFLKEAKSTLMLPSNNISLDDITLDFSVNSKSLKKSIYQHLIKRSLEIEDIKEILFNYFYTNFEGNDNYRAHLDIYEKPLIEAGLEKYGSQLQLSAALGINRNTLRKKIYEHGIN